MWNEFYFVVTILILSFIWSWKMTTADIKHKIKMQKERKGERWVLRKQYPGPL